MLFFYVNDDGDVIDVSEEPRPGRVSRNHLKHMDEAEELARSANWWAIDNGRPERYIATDAGPKRSPRYDVIAAPRVGDECSYSFNGDTTPDGKIERISRSMRKITTSTGRAYWRVGQSGCWRRAGTWSLIPGHHYERNPSF